MADTVVIITGAVPLERALTGHLPDGATVIAADSGLDHALAAGVEPDVVVGDLDSVSADGAEWARRNAELREHPTAKGATDTELAIAAALELAPRRLVVIGGPDGTRLDHSLAAIGALGSEATAAVREIEAWWGTARLRVVHGPGRASLDVAAGATFSVIALHGPAGGVRVTGARWNLDDVELPPVAGWGVSNVAEHPPVVVGVERGVVTIIVPEGAHVP